MNNDHEHDVHKLTRDGDIMRLWLHNSNLHDPLTRMLAVRDVEHDVVGHWKRSGRAPDKKDEKVSKMSEGHHELS